jgi:cytochrome P450
VDGVTGAGGFDPGAPAVLADPATAFAALRAQCPVHHSTALENPMYVFADREGVHTVLTDPVTWSNRYGPGISFSDDNDGDLQRIDPPLHEVRRRFLRAPFLPRAVEATGPEIERLAGELVDSFAARGHAELHDDFALPLPVTAFTTMMGIPPEEAGEFKSWADTLTLGMTYPDRARDARRAMQVYTTEQVRKRRAAVAAAALAPDADPVGSVVPEGLLSHLACHRLDDGSYLTEHELSGMVGQLLVAGHETTTSLITNAVWRLLEDRSRWERLLAEPELVPNVIEESLRFDPPVLSLCKTNNVTVERGGHTIEPDSKVMILYASANRDPALFDAPDEFRIDRPLVQAKRHYSFGWGIHFCLGSHVARQTGRIALATLLTRLPGLRLAGSTDRVGAPFLWGRARLPVAW